MEKAAGREGMKQTLRTEAWQVLQRLHKKQVGVWDLESDTGHQGCSEESLREPGVSHSLSIKCHLGH
jgi:hypothetical protein